VELVEPAKEEVDKKAAYWVVGIFFWFLIAVLIVAIVWGYL
jgi:small-conductance mechanosensitive channel